MKTVTSQSRRRRRRRRRRNRKRRLNTHIEWARSCYERCVISAERLLALIVYGVNLAGHSEFRQIVQGLVHGALLRVQTGQLATIDRIVEIVVRAPGPMHFAGTSSFGHDESVRVTIVALAIVHDTQTMAQFVRNHEGRLQVGGFVYRTAIVALTHSADPSETQDAGVIFARRCFVQIEPDRKKSCDNFS